MIVKPQVKELEHYGEQPGVPRQKTEATAVSLKNMEVSWAPVKTSLRVWRWMPVVVAWLHGNCTVAIVVAA